MSVVTWGGSPAALATSGGGTLNGALTVTGNASVGGTLTLSADPAAALHAATRQYVDARGLPTGGTTGEVLTKTSATNFAASWQAPAAATVSWPLLAPNGSAAAPSYALANSTGTGIYSPGANRLGFASAGTARWEVRDTGHLMPMTDASYDIGGGATRPRDVFLGRDLVAAGKISAGAAVAGLGQAGDLSTNRGNGQGVVYFGGNSLRYLYHDNTLFNLNGGTLVIQNGGLTASGNLITNNYTGTGWANALGGNVVIGGLLALGGNGSVTLSWDGSYIKTGQPFRASTLTADTTVWAITRLITGNWDVGASNNFGGGAITAVFAYSIYPMRGWADNTANNNAIVVPNIGDYRGQGLAQAWPTWGSADHAARYGLRIEPIRDPLAMVRSLEPYSYEHASMHGDDTPFWRDDGTIEASPCFGFRPSEVAEVLPELVVYSSAGEPQGLDLDRMGVVLWAAFKQYVAATDARIAALEHIPKGVHNGAATNGVAVRR